MIKQYITLTGIISFFLVFMLWAISLLFPAYTRYFTYIAIIILVPVIILDLIKKRKEDKVEDTESFKLSIYNILISAVILGVLFFIINQK
ncbi:hypothetical protein [Flavobacterium sp. FlaQc-48]|uniref:hypothetical protein n=1 Tax=Flavobacterium sp. FlaQc-48 TaxID=3374181 RepID=UPI003756D633